MQPSIRMWAPESCCPERHGASNLALAASPFGSKGRLRHPLLHLPVDSQELCDRQPDEGEAEERVVHTPRGDGRPCDSPDDRFIRNFDFKKQAWTNVGISRLLWRYGPREDEEHADF